MEVARGGMDVTQRDESEANVRAQIEREGYVIVPAAVPRECCAAVVADIWEHTGARPDDRESWYRPGIIGPTGMVEMYHYQSMWDCRQHPDVHRAFTEVFGADGLWVSLDRVNLKPPADPAHAAYDNRGFMHWDTDITRYPELPFGVQGVLALTDTDATMGGFQCMPDLYRDLQRWLSARRATGADPRRPDVDAYPVVRPELRAGDLLIWTTLLPHGNGHNVSRQPRLAQYISMGLARWEDEPARRQRVRCWEESLPPPADPFPGDPRQIEQRRGRRAVLTALGRRLLGLERWGEA